MGQWCYSTVCELAQIDKKKAAGNNKCITPARMQNEERSLCKVVCHCSGSSQHSCLCGHQGGSALVPLREDELDAA